MERFRNGMVAGWTKLMPFQIKLLNIRGSMHHAVLECAMDKAKRMTEFMDRNFPQSLDHQLPVR